jgi:hypothetical protein
VLVSESKQPHHLRLAGWNMSEKKQNHTVPSGSHERQEDL